MTEVAYLPQIECVITKEDGLFDTLIVYVPDENGNRQFLRVGKGARNAKAKRRISQSASWTSMPRSSGARGVAPGSRLGARRLWVRLSSFRPQRVAS